jgi:alpha-D-xyloside xylohydrolase
LAEQAKNAVKRGYPILQPLILHHNDDSVCWNIDDEFYCGSSLLIAPVMNSLGIRDVYLPKGFWIDFWTGEKIKGPVFLHNLEMPLDKIPVYAVFGSTIKVYPEPVKSTGDIQPDKIITIAFDESYNGINSSVLHNLIQL